MPRPHGADPTPELVLSNRFTVPRSFRERLRAFGQLIDLIVLAEPAAGCLDCSDSGVAAHGGPCRCPAGASS